MRLLPCLFMMCCLAGFAHAEPGMRPILDQTLQSNPSLHVQRQSLTSQIEEVEQAYAFLYPSVDAEAALNGFSSDSDPGSDRDGVEKTMGLTLSQYLYRGGQTDNGIIRQLNLLKAEEYEYRNSVQDVFNTVIANAARLRFQRNSLSLAVNNAERLAHQYESARAGFEVGELTRTDVAQAEARLAEARSEIIRVQGALYQAEAEYSEVTNKQPPKQFHIADIAALIPQNRDEMVDMVLAGHPEIIAQMYRVEAANRAVGAAKGVLYPQLELRGDLTQSYDTQSGLDEQGGGVIGVRASLPLFNRGINRSEIRQSQSDLYAEKAELDQLRFSYRSDAVTAWQAYQTARSELGARDSQLRAAQIALEGVTAERKSGTRTVLDVLDANQELLDARNALQEAQRDQIIASYELLALTGLLTPEAFSLQDPTLNHPQLVGDSFGKTFGQLANPLLKVRNAAVEALGLKKIE